MFVGPGYLQYGFQGDETVRFGLYYAERQDGRLALSSSPSAPFAIVLTGTDKRRVCLLPLVVLLSFNFIK